MKRITFIISICLCLVAIRQPADAQTYKTGIGVRGGIYSGISVKQFFYADESSYRAFELHFTTRYKGFMVTALFDYVKEWHIQGMRYATIYWTAAFGAHIGMYDGFDNMYLDSKGQPYAGKVYPLGADLMLGIEYVFADFPISLGFDVKPMYDFYKPGYSNVGVDGVMLDAAGTIRFVFGR